MRGCTASLGNAMRAAGIEPQNVEQSESGDGVLVLLDPQISKVRLLHPLVPRLGSGLARYNRTAPGSERLRLRVVVHAGELLQDAHGRTGEDLVLAFRLLDSDAARVYLAQTAADLVLVVSDAIYQGVVKHGYGAIDPARFQSVWISAKETSTRAWLHIPGTDGRKTAASSAVQVATRLPPTLALRSRLPALLALDPPAESVHDLTPLASNQFPGTWQIPARTYVENYQPGGSWFQFSPEGSSIFGYASGEGFAPNFWKTVLYPADRDRVLAADEWSDQTLEPFRMTYRVTTRDGQTVWVRDECVVVYDETGTPRCWLGTMFPLTDQTIVELDATRRLEFFDELRTTFLSGLSSELRPPLANILKICQTLEQAKSRLSEDAAHELTRGISHNIRRLDRYLTDAIDLQRLGWGAVALDRRPFDISALVERVAARWRMDGKWPQVSASSAAVWLDADKVERILDELLANVSNHTPPGTPVWVRVRGNGTGILLVVEVAGPGFPMEHQNSLLKRFPSGEHALSPSPGLAIGLALVLRLIELHGGVTWVEDRPGGGTSISVLLPGPPLTSSEASA